jgi:hypothetical protein
VLLTLPTWAAPDKDKDKDLPALKASFEKSLKAIIADCDASTKSWPSNYVAALKDLQTKFQKEGNLDGWSNVKSELDRFNTDPRIPDGNLSSVAGLQMIQAKFRELPAQVALDKNQKIVALSQKHIAKLTAWQTDLTKQGNMEDALAVNAEIKRVKGNPEVASAEFALSEQEAKAAQGKKEERPGAEKAPPGGKTADAKEPEPIVQDGDVKIYAGKAPSLPGVTFKNMPLRPTSNVGAKRKLNVSAMMSSSSDERGSSSASYYGSSKSSYGSTSSRVRVGIKTVASESVLENLVVLVEYYSKEVKTTAGKIVPDKMLAKCITVPKVDVDGVWIDCPEASVYKSSYRSTHSYGHSSRYKSGREFYGAIISVFESDKTLAYQAVTGGTLDEFAPTEPPDDRPRRAPSKPDRLAPVKPGHDDDG